VADLYLNGTQYSAVRLKLRQWLLFEKAQVNIKKLIENKQTDEYANALCLLVSNTLGAPLNQVQDAPWYDVVSAYGLINELNQVRGIPLTKQTGPPDSKEPEIPWEYSGREWYWWLHTLSKEYGWLPGQVEELDIDDAISLLQEILVDEQINREWQWSLTELAYPYNETTKKHVFKALKRPEWMRDQPQVILPGLKLKFPKFMIPVGRVIGEDENERLVS